MNHENECKVPGAQSQLGLIGKQHQSPTLSANIDARIEHLEQQIVALKLVRAKLAEPGGILQIPIDDLRFAMQY